MVARMMRIGWMAIALAGCATQVKSPTPQVIGTGSVTTNGTVVASAAWMQPSAIFDDTMPDLPTTYYGWTVLFSADAPGTPCADVTSPSWTAQLGVPSQTTGSMPEDAPITPGAFVVQHYAAPPSAGVQVLGEHFSGVADTGTVTVTEFDDEHIAGSFTASGSTAAIPAVPFTTSGTFTATRCR
jgi:hypothetical protein